MDNILKALEMAKSEKQAFPESKYEEPGQSQNAARHTIAYTHTRVIQVDHQILRDRRVITGMDPGPVMDAYRLLRTQVLQRMRENNWSALAVTSPSQHSGKSLTAVNLAISMAMEVNQTVLLVDLDLRHPSLHQYFGYKPEFGLIDYLAHSTPLRDILFNPSLERLVVLPGRQSIANSSEMLSSPVMVNLANELKHRYPSRLVIFDLPPTLRADDALAFSPYVDAALVVVEEGKTTRDELAVALDILQPVNIIGTVLNKGRN